MWAALGQADPEPRGRKLSNEVPGDEVPDGDRRWGALPETTIGRRRAALHLSTKGRMFYKQRFSLHNYVIKAPAGGH